MTPSIAESWHAAAPYAGGSSPVVCRPRRSKRACRAIDLLDSGGGAAEDQVEVVAIQDDNLEAGVRSERWPSGHFATECLRILALHRSNSLECHLAYFVDALRETAEGPVPDLRCRRAYRLSCSPVGVGGRDDGALASLQGVAVPRSGRAHGL